MRRTYQCPICETLHHEADTDCCDGANDAVTIVECDLGMDCDHDDHHFGLGAHVVDGHELADRRDEWVRLHAAAYAPCHCVYPEQCACPARLCGRDGWTADEAWRQVGQEVTP